MRNSKLQLLRFTDFRQIFYSDRCLYSDRPICTTFPLWPLTGASEPCSDNIVRSQDFTFNNSHLVRAYLKYWSRPALTYLKVNVDAIRYHNETKNAFVPMYWIYTNLCLQTGGRRKLPLPWSKKRNSKLLPRLLRTQKNVVPNWWKNIWRRFQKPWNVWLI